MPQTRYLINNRNLFLTTLEAGSPRSGSQLGRMRVLFRDAGLQTCHCILTAWKEGHMFLLGSLFKAPSGPKHLPKAPSLNAITLGIWISTCKSGDTGRQLQHGELEPSLYLSPVSQSEFSYCKKEPFPWVAPWNVVCPFKIINIKIVQRCRKCL